LGQVLAPNMPGNIGVFDSGVGGLSVLRALMQQIPGEDMLYVADQAHVPYGPRPLEQVRQFSEAITRFLLEKSAKIVVVACNSASAAALSHLRTTFPDTPFVGMEPAVKPAAETTQTRVVGVLATPATFQGALFESVLERFAAGVTVLRDTCPGLVQQIEAGDLSGPRTRAILEAALRPMLDQHVDTVVLACTHFPFVIPTVQKIVGPNVRVIDPAPAIARQTLRLLQARELGRQRNGQARVEYFTSGERTQLEAALEKLLGLKAPVATLSWQDESHLAAAVKPGPGPVSGTPPSSSKVHDG
jgi:glutamate racemase